jgi:hypothetical protein
MLHKTVIEANEAIKHNTHTNTLSRILNKYVLVNSFLLGNNKVLNLMKTPIEFHG